MFRLEPSYANMEFRRGRARQPVPRASLLPPRKFCACRVLNRSRWGSTESHPTKRRREEVMKRTLEMERVKGAACGLLVPARQWAFVVAKKGRKALPDFSKNPRHFSKNFPALTLNFENFSDLIFCEQNLPPPKSSQTGAVASRCRDLTVTVWSPAFTRRLVSRALDRLKAGL